MLKLTKQILIISFVLLFLISCKPYKLNGVTQKEIIPNNFQNLYFSESSTDFVYKAHIEVYGNNLSGILVAKKMNDSIHRIALTTDFGNTLLDFELSEKDFKVNYIVSNLNRSFIISTLKKDFRLLLTMDHSVLSVFENKDDIIYKSYEDNSYNYFYQRKKDNIFYKLVNTSKTKEKVTFTFLAKNTTFAESVLIQHYNIPLKIELNQINK